MPSETAPADGPVAATATTMPPESGAPSEPPRPEMPATIVQCSWVDQWKEALNLPWVVVLVGLLSGLMVYLVVVYKWITYFGTGGGIDDWLFYPIIVMAALITAADCVMGGKFRSFVVRLFVTGLIVGLCIEPAPLNNGNQFAVVLSRALLDKLGLGLGAPESTVTITTTTTVTITIPSVTTTTITTTTAYTQYIMSPQNFATETPPVVQ